MVDSNFDELYGQKEDYYSSPSDGMIECITKYSPNRGLALDLGCGQGRNSIWLAQNGFIVDAIDVSITALKSIKNNNKFIKVKINPIHLDITKINFPINRYDFIIVQTTLNHIELINIPNVCNEIYNSLMVGGLLYVVCFTQEDPGYKGNRYSSECSSLVKYYFKKNELQNYFTRMKILEYNEYIKLDTTHGPIHKHGKVKLIGVK